MIYYSWIPTIKGKLDLNLMGRSSFFKEDLIKNGSTISIENLNIDNIINDKYQSDDSLLSLIFPSEPSAYLEQLLNFKLTEKENSFSGNISITYAGISGIDDTFSIIFDLKFNGSIILKEYKTSNEQENNFQTEKRVQVLYVLLKNIIHSHKHHNHKVDTTILVSTDETSWRSNVIDNLLCYLKLLEGGLDRKNFEKNYGKIQDLDSELDGFLAYGRTFFTLCKNDPECKEDISKNYAGLYENTILSIKAKIKRIESQVNRDKELNNRIWVIYPVLISFGIFSKWDFPSWFLWSMFVFLIIFFLIRIIEAVKDKYYYDDFPLYEHFFYLKNYKFDSPQAVIKHKKGEEEDKEERILTKEERRLSWLLKRRNLNWISHGYIVWLIAKNKMSKLTS